MRSKKKSIKIFAAVSLSLVTVCAAFVYDSCMTGSTLGVKKEIGSSEIYSAAEIEDAMQTAMHTFRTDYRGCKMETISYDEEISLTLGSHDIDKYPGEDIIVLCSSYNTGRNEGAAPAYTTVSDWEWILTRSENGKWTVRGSGNA